MSQSIATLGISVKTTGVREAERDLDKLGKAGERLAKDAPRAAKGMDGVTASGKRMADTLKPLPAQFAGIATSLARGASPLQVVARNAGALFSPLTLAAGAAAALGVAWNNAQAQEHAFSVALAKSGNYAGQTAESMGRLVDQLDQLDGVTRSGAAQALVKVAESGKFAGDQFTLVAQAAAQMQAATGQAIDETIKKFQSLGSSPVEALHKLNTAEHFLTQAQLDRVQALENEGRAQDASAEALRIYARHLDDVAQQARESLPAMARWWGDIKDEIGSASGEVETYMGLIDRAIQRQGGLKSAQVSMTSGFANTSLLGLVPDWATNTTLINALGKQWLRGKAGPDFSNVVGTPAVDSAAIAAQQELLGSRNRLVATYDRQFAMQQEINRVEAEAKRTGLDRLQTEKLIAAVREKYAEREKKAPHAAKVDNRAAIDALRESQRMLEAQGSWSDQLLDLQAQLAGPMAQVMRQYERDMTSLERAFQSGEVALSDYAQMQDALAEARDRDAEAVRSQKTMAEQFLEDLQFENQLLAATTKEQIRLTAARYAGADATREQVEEAARLLTTNEQLARAQENWTEVNRNVADSLYDFVSGAESARDALEGFFDTLNSQILRNITEDWADALTDILKGAVGSKAASGTGGFNWGQLIGGLLGGFSQGGYTGDGPRNEVAGVVHRGEYVLNASTVRALRSGGAAAIGAGGGSGQLPIYKPPVLNFHIAGSVDRRSAGAIASATGRVIQQQMARR